MPPYETILVTRDAGRLTITLNRPAAKNAMSFAMLDELAGTVEDAGRDPEARVIVLRGAGGHFSSGGDLADMAAARMAPVLAAPSDATDRSGSAVDPIAHDPFALANRRFGRLLNLVAQCPKPTVAVIEGACFGGGFGLACVADITLVHERAHLGMPEVTLGLIPAQIIPFVARRIGESQARRLALSGLKFHGAEAFRLGIAHAVEMDADGLNKRLDEECARLLRAAPGAVALTKTLMRDMPAAHPVPDTFLTDAARVFAQAARGSEAEEGARAFFERREPAWMK